MTRSWRSWCYKLGLATALALGGAIAAFRDCALAQIVPDATLGAQRSVVTPNAGGRLVDTITGGATRGTNLFHSFGQFSVLTGRGAYFNNSLQIQNIITRVTGGSVSNIDGLLRANGKANLFLINPNGIIFGPNASLNIGGSFFASTANSLNFADGSEFSAKTPATNPLLTVSVPIGLQYGASAGSITNQSTAVNSSNIPVGLQVQPGNTLALVGGNVSVDGGSLTATGGRVELGGLTTAGMLGLNSDGSLSYPAAVQRGNVSLTNGAFVNVAAAGGGSIAVNARNLDISGGSSVLAGIGQGLGAVGSKAGDVTLNATDAITLRQASRIQNRVNSNAIGDGGNINVTGGSLAILDGGSLSASTFGQGNAGNVNVDVRDAVTLSGVNNDTGSYSRIASTVNTGSVGNGGTITIKAGTLSILDQALLNAGTYGQGNAGSVFVQAKDSVSLANSEILNNVESGANGNAGGISITAGSLSLTDGAQLSASTFGQGNAGSILVQASGPVSLANSAILSNVDSAAVGNGGNINIKTGALSVTDGAQLSASTSGQGNAGSVFVQAEGSVSVANGNIFSIISPTAVGNGGNINITAGSLSLTNGASVSANTSGQGNAGSVFVQAKDLVSLTNSSILSGVGSGAVGNGGEITLNARSLSLDNGTQLATPTQGQGNAGNIQVNATDSVFVRGRSFLQANTFAQGNAGSITIAGRDGVVPIVEFDGTGANGLDSSAFTAVGKDSTGKGGDVNITARSLSLTNGAELTTGTAGKNLGQDAGNIRVNATDSVTVSGGSLLQSATFGQGNAGNVTIQAGDKVAFDGVRSDGGFSSGAATVVGSVPGAIGNRKGGDINIISQSLSLTNGAQLNASTSGQGNAGNVNINVSDAFTLAGVNRGFTSAALSMVNSGAVGNGGIITIKAGSLSLSNGAQLQTLVSGASNKLPAGRGNAGDVNINVSDAVTFAGVNNGFTSGAFSSVESGGVGKGGNVNVMTGSLSLTNGAEVSASTFGKGDAGSVTIAARDNLSFDGVGNTGFSSGAFSTVSSGAVGKGGDINVTTGSLSLTNGAALSSSTSGQGNAGSVKILANGPVSLDGVGRTGFDSGVSSAVNNGAVGNGGGINIKAGSLSITNQAGLFSSTFGIGDAGNISVGVDNAVSLTNGSYIRGSVEPGGQGKGADIGINARSLSVTNGAQIGAFLTRQQGNLAGGKGSGGQIQVNAADSVTLSGTGSTGFSSGLLALSERGASGPAGNITVSTGNFQVADGAIVAAGIFNSGGDGGNININVNNFAAINGGQVLTNTRSSGNAGSIRLNAKDSITFTGSDPNLAARQAQVAQRLQSPGQTDQVSDVIVNESPASGLFANTAVGSTGSGGSIFIDPSRLTITDGAGVAVDSLGSGRGGSLNVQAGYLTLDNRAFLSAIANSGNGGNITLNVPSLLEMRHNSQISATAGTSGGSGNGGNIDINTRFLVALPSEDSDITANAAQGRGGNIRIASQGIFGIQSQPRDTPQSDITANSQFGINGTVQLITLDINPTLDLVVLPAQIVDAAGLIAQSCPAGGGLSSNRFIVSGRGGLPPSPSQTLSPDAVLTNWNTLDHPVENRSGKTHSGKSSSSVPTQIVEATGWVIGPKGEVILTAQNPSVTPSNSVLQPATCQGL